MDQEKRVDDPVVMEHIKKGGEIVAQSDEEIVLEVPKGSGGLKLLLWLGAIIGLVIALPLGLFLVLLAIAVTLLSSGTETITLPLGPDGKVRRPEREPRGEITRNEVIGIIVMVVILGGAIAAAIILGG